MIHLSFGGEATEEIRDMGSDRVSDSSESINGWQRRSPN